ncbi:hypothetical protein J7E73_11165 [Paenibacillus albidus]|uniref:hypothetical protein n=1 Tax=Paenibacillus albidus TaxID=2041023 RepID=UPI001BEBF710|nr:hypothetical protein [Paenibacillus albidus]MBT2289684.1 hypothetical protein [Paenibacillus albidus]
MRSATTADCFTPDRLKIEKLSTAFMTKKEYDSAEVLKDLKFEIEQGKYYGSICKQFTEWTGDDVTFTDNEKQKLLYLLVKKHPRRQELNTRSFCVHQNIMELSCVLQTTINENPHTGQDELHVVISGGHGYNEYGTEKFKELLIHF